MPAVNPPIARLAKRKYNFLPLALCLNLIMGADLLVAPSFAFAEAPTADMHLSLASATLTQSEASDAVAHSQAALASQPGSTVPGSMIVASAGESKMPSFEAPSTTVSVPAPPPPPRTSTSTYTAPVVSSDHGLSDDELAAMPATPDSEASTADKDGIEISAPATTPAPIMTPVVAPVPTPEVKPPLIDVAVHSNTPTSDKSLHNDVFAQPKPASTAETSPVAPLTPADSGAIRPEQAKAWAQEIQVLERENVALRDKLHMTDKDPLADIQVDAVTQIREDVLRARVVELEKELDKLHMKSDPGTALPQKTGPSRPAASLDDSSTVATP